MPEKKSRGGKRAGAGRPRRVDEEKMYGMMDAVLAPSEYWELLTERCKSKNPDAALKLFAAYRFGNPIARVEVSGRDGSAIITEIIIKEEI